MKLWINPLIVAFVFLTRFPMPALKTITPEDEGRSLSCYPIVGLTIGLTLSLITLLLHPYFPSIVLSAIVLISWIIITGGLHLDGLGDSADGWMSGSTTIEHTLEIMHDSRNGSGAIIAISCVLLIKFVALTVLIEQQYYQGLIIAPVLARCVIPMLLDKSSPLHLPYVQTNGIANNIVKFSTNMVSFFASIFAITTLLVLSSIPTAIILIVSGLLTLLVLRRLMLKHLGGTNGDTAGACIEIIESVSLLAISFILH